LILNGAITHDIPVGKAMSEASNLHLSRASSISIFSGLGTSSVSGASGLSVSLTYSCTQLLLLFWVPLS